MLSPAYLLPALVGGAMPLPASIKCSHVFVPHVPPPAFAPALLRLQQNVRGNGPLARAPAAAAAARGRPQGRHVGRGPRIKITDGAFRYSSIDRAGLDLLSISCSRSSRGCTMYGPFLQ